MEVTDGTIYGNIRGEWFKGMVKREEKPQWGRNLHWGEDNLHVGERSSDRGGETPTRG